ncbi:MAG: hypothetical protein ACI3ZZ_02160 [Candidatus Aphodosoma sp.]
MIDEYGMHEDNQVPTTYKSTLHTIGLIPTLNFTYFNRENVNLYSGFGIGAMVIADKGWASALPAFDLCLLGVSFGNEHWYGNVELGCLYSTLILVYTVPTRIVSVGFGYRF